MKRLNATAIRDESAFAAAMIAVIIYDKFDFAARANSMLERAAHRTGETMHWSVNPWRTDMLKLPPASEAALAEAAEARLIVLAVLQVHSLAPCLVDWLERWATRRQVQEAALAVWNGGNADTSLVRATPELSQFAERHGLSLIFDDNALVGDKSSMFTSEPHKRDVSFIPTPQHTLEQPARDHYQHGGINE
jgi:hypothetical protein